MAAWQPSAGATLLVASGPAGSHLLQDSYVVYSGMRIYRTIDLSAHVARGLFVPHDPMSGPLLQRIRAGRLTSPRTKREFTLLAI